MSLSELLSSLADTTGKLLLPDSEDYKIINGSYFTAFGNEIKPSYIAKPTNVEDFSKLIKILRPLLIRGDCQIAVRGGGHTPYGSSANIEGGVTVDTRGLKGITLSEDKSIVEIAAGETWTTVYKELEKHGLSTAGGRVGRVGVTGFVLGGGLSLYSTSRGFACDSVVDFEVVLASGEVVHANARENSDLWIALKGGLNNFGIVTSFKMKTFESGNIWGGATYYMPGTYSQVIEAACDLVSTETDEYTHVMCSVGYGYGHQIVICLMYHTKGQENPPSLQRFTSIQPQVEQMNSMKVGSHLDFCDELSAFTSDGSRQFYASCTIRPDVALMTAFEVEWQKTLATLKDAEGFTFAFGFQPLAKSLLEHSALEGGNSTGLTPSDGPLFVVLLNPVWASAADDERMTSGVTKLLAEFRRLASEKDLLHPYIFTNYAYKTDDVFKGYGEESVAKLKEASTKWDPEGIFQKGVPGGWKVGNL
ncbi:hypothetical protein SBOR_4210 [Sclerotinia borealis F-4128]|uniref:FAD-binding PCMH-type domain-containing protein n=1 Tax=Sclerotinia borealis (strain F-4128) TaxID=1432307 RepID=W9CLP0_SCLBF|nr:hypothetical protein SBOR_4210 [Sclerotinia borealis F-4128]